MTSAAQNPPFLYLISQYYKEKLALRTFGSGDGRRMEAGTEARMGLVWEEDGVRDQLPALSLYPRIYPRSIPDLFLNHPLPILALASRRHASAKYRRASDLRPNRRDATSPVPARLFFRDNGKSARCGS